VREREKERKKERRKEGKKEKEKERGNHKNGLWFSRVAQVALRLFLFLRLTVSSVG
jgi:hypothetical protein